MQKANELKQAEEVSSTGRMAKFMADEEARKEELSQSLAKQQEQERQVLKLVFGAVALFLLLLIIYALIVS